jgi:hypothetical protein
VRLLQAGDVAKGSSRDSGASRVLLVPKVRVPKVHVHRVLKVLRAKGRVIVKPIAKGIASVADRVVTGRAAIVPEATEVRVQVVTEVAIGAVTIEGRVPAAGRASMGLRWTSNWRS